MSIQEYQEYTQCIDVHTPFRDTYRVGSNPVEVRTKPRYRVRNKYYMVAVVQQYRKVSKYKGIATDITWWQAV